MATTSDTAATKDFTDSPRGADLTAFADIQVPVMTTHVAGVCEVVRTDYVTPLMRRITFHGPGLKGFAGNWRAEMMVRLNFPPAGSNDPAEPYATEDGTIQFRSTGENEVSAFSPYGQDKLVRAYTARAFRPDVLELDVDFVLHDQPGLASDWARRAKPGDRLGVVEYLLPPTHRGAADQEADVYVMFADEASLPALQTNLEAFRPGAKVIAFAEVADRNEEQPVSTQADLTLTWLHRNGAKAGKSGLLMKALAELEWPKGNVYFSVSAEIKTVTELRAFIKKNYGLRKHGYKTQAYWRLGKTEVERMDRMTELTLVKAQTDPSTFMESFENIGMDIVDEELLQDPIYGKAG